MYYNWAQIAFAYNVAGAADYIAILWKPFYWQKFVLV